MIKSHRSLLFIVVPVALLLGWFAFGDRLLSRQADADKSATGEAGQNHLKQAAASLVAAAKERVAAAKTDDDALKRAQLSFEALRLIGAVGDFDTSPQADELFDALQTGSHPAIVDTIIQVRLRLELGQWNQLSSTERAAAVDQFVSAVKKTSLTHGQAALLIHAAHMLDNDNDRKLLTKALKEISLLAHDSKDAQVKKMADLYDGIARRLELPGKPLELEGKLLDGNVLDWKSYRGKVVLVDFHASWCGPCRAEVPNILENFKAYHDKGFEVIGVNMDKERSGAEKYVEQTGFKFPIIFSDDPAAAGWEVPLARKYGITGIPQVILVDRDGNVVSTKARGGQLGVLLKKLLGEPTEPAATAKGAESSGVVPASAQEEAAPAEPAPDASAAPEPPK